MMAGETETSGVAPPTVGEGRKSSRLADIVSGGIWLAIGFAIIVGSWRMDRLESQGVPWFTAPGLVPGVLGVLIALAALGIVLRALRRPAAPSSAMSTSDDSIAAHGEHVDTGFGGRALLTLALCLGFAIGLVGRVPFWIAAAIYLFLHIFLLQFPDRRERGQVGRGIVVAAIIALCASLAISTIFQDLFLVRLP